MSEKKHRNRSVRVLVWLVLVLALCGVAISGYKLLEIWLVYQTGNDSYKELNDLVRSGALLLSTPKADSQPSDGSEAASRTPILNVEVPDVTINFSALQAINKDAVAWLFSPNTVIDYPVMRASDYEYYLHHLPDGTGNPNGTLFIDYNCASDFSDRLSIIYGHHMKSGRMFGSIVGYKKQSYFEEHPYMYLYTAEGNYRIAILYGCVIAAGEWRDRAFMYEANVDSLLAYAASNTTCISEASYHEEDKVIVLSTCSYEFNSARYVVIGVLQPEYLYY